MKPHAASGNFQIPGNIDLVFPAPEVEMKSRQMGVTDDRIKAVPLCHKFIQGLVPGDTFPVDRSEKTPGNFEVGVFKKRKIFFPGQPEGIAS
jgi:hypothetical protein